VCRECRRGDICLCPCRVALGVDLDGGLAEYALVPATQPGARVVILGGGVIGQLMAQLARLAEATTVVLVTRQESRRRLAEELGGAPHDCEMEPATAVAWQRTGTAAPERGALRAPRPG